MLMPARKSWYVLFFMEPFKVLWVHLRQRDPGVQGLSAMICQTMENIKPVLMLSGVQA